MQVAFIGKPTINFNLRLVGGDITAFPFIEKLLTNLIKNVLVNLMVWPNKLDIGITNDLGAKSVSNSGIVRITIRPREQLAAAGPAQGGGQDAAGGGARGDGWRVRQTQNRARDEGWRGPGPDLRRRDLRRARARHPRREAVLSVVDTATTYKNVKAAGRQAFGVGKARRRRGTTRRTPRSSGVSSDAHVKG